jgi:hypothetical protein
LEIIWAASADKHGVPREDALYAMAHAEGMEQVAPGDVSRVTAYPDRQRVVFVGHPHAQTERYLEVIVAHQAGRAVFFHVMPLTDTFRYLLEGDE